MQIGNGWAARSAEEGDAGEDAEVGALGASWVLRSGNCDR